MNFLTSSLLLVALVVAVPSMASDTITLDTEFPLNPAQENNKGPYVRETHGIWEVRCVKIDEKENCTLYQLLKDKNNISVAEINIEILPEGNQAAAGITVITPLGTLLTAQLGWSIDANRVRKYSFSWCEQSGCVARFGLTNEDVLSMKKGASGKVSVVSISNPEELFELTLSLNGFTAAWNSATPN